MVCVRCPPSSKRFGLIKPLLISKWLALREFHEYLLQSESTPLWKFEDGQTLFIQKNQVESHNSMILLVISLHPKQIFEWLELVFFCSLCVWWVLMICSNFGPNNLISFTFSSSTFILSEIAFGYIWKRFEGCLKHYNSKNKG